MKPEARLSAIIELLANFEETLEGGKKNPVDAMLAKYFRENRYIGSHDRGEIAGTFYFVVRNYESLKWWAKQKSHHTSPRILTLLACVFHLQYSVERIKELCSGERYAPKYLSVLEQELLEFCVGKTLQHEKMTDEARYNVPLWLIKLLRKHYGDDAPALMAGMNEEAAVDIRVNVLRATKEQVQKALAEQGLKCVDGAYSKHGLRLNRRSGLFALEAFKHGWFEVQDEGSQLVADLVDAKAGERVVDFCAGAGGKTLAIAANMGGKGRILAFDVNEHRMKDLQKRLKRANVQNTESRLIEGLNDPYLRRHKHAIDWVLVDAPCTGSGTWRRNPDMKWRTALQDLQEMVGLQASILEAAAKLVKSGGKLVYATCSILPEENTQQVQKFLSNNPDFSLQPMETPSQSDYLQLLPHQHHTDGFFAAILKKS
jgi:16S rRNA (cytosine967-C5)-methyltransferase